MSEERSSPGRSSAASAPASQLAGNLVTLRKERQLTLNDLAARSGVSRAMLSKIERGQAMPTATVLGKIAAGLDVGLTQLVSPVAPIRTTLLKPAQQAIFRDPESGLERRNLTPLFADSMVDFALNTLPPGGRAEFPAHRTGVEEYLFVAQGALIVTLSDEDHALTAGDSLSYAAHQVHVFSIRGSSDAVFYIVVDRTRTA